MAKTNEEKAEEITWKLFDDGLSFYNYMAQRQKIQSAIMEMAQWKDEQFKAERQALIDKACELSKIPPKAQAMEAMNNYD